MKTYIISAILAALINPAYFFAHVPAYRYTLEEEAYVEDIPFNTTALVYGKAISMPEEEYVDDIPFNTAIVAMQAGAQLPDEAYVDDIPFDTHAMVMNTDFNLPEEAYVDDIPFDTQCIVNNRHLKNAAFDKCLISKKEKDASYGNDTPDSIHASLAMKTNYSVK